MVDKATSIGKVQPLTNSGIKRFPVITTRD